MKLVALSDTHGRHAEVVVPAGDVLVHCGDFTMMGTYAQIHSFAEWFGKLPHKYKIVVAGNHDFGMQSPVGKALLLDNGITYLEDEVTSVEGLSFYGSPWTPRFGKWAFMEERGGAIARKWARIPDDVDVLITHGPPHGILDLSPKWGGEEHLGCEALRERVEGVRPRLHVFGHIHGGAGAEVQEPTLFVNAACLDDEYVKTSDGWSVDLDTKPWHVNLLAV